MYNLMVFTWTELSGHLLNRLPWIALQQTTLVWNYPPPPSHPSSSPSPQRAKHMLQGKKSVLVQHATPCKAYIATDSLEEVFAFSGAKKDLHMGSPRSGQIRRCKKRAQRDDPGFPAKENRETLKDPLGMPPRHAGWWLGPTECTTYHTRFCIVLYSFFCCFF